MGVLSLPSRPARTVIYGGFIVKLQANLMKSYSTYIAFTADVEISISLV